MTDDNGPLRCFGDIPGDLLGAIYRRCSSFYDRARFAAVCTSWRAAAAASCQPKLSPLPILLPSTGNGRLDRRARAYSPEDGRVLRAPLPWFPYGKRIVGSYDGGWVAAATGCRIEIVNLFTRACSVPSKGDITCRCPINRQTTRKISIEKVVFSKDPTTKEGCIVAAMTTSCAVALCRLGFSDDGGWITQGCELASESFFVDIAFCNGELYGLSFHEQLYRLVVIRRNKDGAPVGLLFKRLASIGPNNYDPKRYIFELGGKLAMAVHVRGYEAAFMVLELTIDNASESPCKYMWTEVTSLGDRALFLGPGCCKAVQVSAVGMRRGQVEGNRIYYSKQQRQLPNGKHLDKFELGSCTVFSYESRETHPWEISITSRGYHYIQKYDAVNGTNSCTWILPPLF